MIKMTIIWKWPPYIEPDLAHPDYFCFDPWLICLRGKNFENLETVEVVSLNSSHKKSQTGIGTENKHCGKMTQLLILLCHFLLTMSISDLFARILLRVQLMSDKGQR